MTESKGTLYVVATPLGNPDDISARALGVLRGAALICAEDTRVSGRLLAGQGDATRLLSLYEHNEQERIPQVLAVLEQGKDVALVSSAGTPGLSDPGYKLIRAAIEAGVRVAPVPGPAALLAALSASGLPLERFCFSSFLPRRGARRLRRLAELARFPGTIVIYEAPLRLAELCRQAALLCGDRRAVVARELTKPHEEFVRGRLSELARRYEEQPPRGEVTLLIEPPVEVEQDAEQLAPLIRRARRPDESPSQAAARLSKELGLGRSEVYEALISEESQ